VRAVDTNILVRALVRDDTAQSARAEEFINSNEIYVPITVILELEWVLRSRYAFAPKLVAQALEKITTLANAVVGERIAVRAAVARVLQGWDFADALHHALSEGCVDFATLDSDLVRRAARSSKVLPAVVKI
jgi:predicted nucleic-acid-binding protein